MELFKGCKHNGFAQEASRAADTEGRVVCSSLELKQVLPLDTMPNCTITLTLSNKISQMKMNGSFSGLSLLKRLLWSILPLEAMLISVLSLPGATLISMISATNGNPAKSKICAAAGCYEQGSFFCNGINDYRLKLRMRHERLL